MTTTVSISVSSGVAISAKSTSMTAGDHVGVFNLAANGGTNNAGLNVVSANTAFSACEVSGHETGHGTLKISHVNPGPDPTSDANAAALSIDLLAGKAGGTAAQGIFLKFRVSGSVFLSERLRHAANQFARGASVRQNFGFIKRCCATPSESRREAGRHATGNSHAKDACRFRAFDCRFGLWNSCLWCFFDAHTAQYFAERHRRSR